MYRCNTDDDELPTVMAPSPGPAQTRDGAAPVTMPMLAVPRPSNVPRDIAEYANAFAAAEELAQAAAHVHAGRYATPPPPALARPPGPRPRAQSQVDTVRRRHAQTFHIPGRSRPTPWSSIALVTFLGVIASLSAMAAFIQFKETNQGPTVTSSVGTPVAPSSPSTNR